jgi:hypothetical protein
MPYRNDVFISYKRGSINEQWLDQIFLPLFTAYLDASLDNEPQIFVDRTNIINGTNWDVKIAYELAHSKCMVSILSPSYFVKRSEWCVKEFLSMKYREEVLGLTPDGSPPCLVWPVMLQSIEKKPPIIHTIQMKDYSEYNRVGEGFKKSEAYYNFQTALQNDCETIVDIINHAPDWQQEWESPKWKASIEARVRKYFNETEDPKQNLPS